VVPEICSTRLGARTYQWLSKAADQGDAQAQYNLGVMYRDALAVAASYYTHSVSNIS
jgi:TPR repeat protein